VEPVEPPEPWSRRSRGAAGAGRSAPDAPVGPEETLPDAPLFALLRSIEQEVLVERVDRIWIFPPRRLEVGETAVVIVAAFPEDDADRRRVFAAHYTVATDATQPRLALAEFGTAPTDRVGRVVEEVVERLKDEPAAAHRRPPASRETPPVGTSSCIPWPSAIWTTRCIPRGVSVDSPAPGPAGEAGRTAAAGA
jgi:hypothetical protein